MVQREHGVREYSGGVLGCPESDPRMSHVLMRTRGGTVCQPDPATIMLDRADGGQLVVYPPRRVWDRTALSRGELLPHLYARFPLVQAAEAHRLMESSKHIGKIVLEVGTA